jgi:short-subunit dehydrogenase
VELKGRTALLTGATGGLGRAIAEALAGQGATLILSSRKRDELKALASGLPGEHRTIVSDLAKEGAAEKLLKEAGEIDVLVANAALPASGLLDGFSQDEIGRALRVNLESPIRMARELIPAMQERGSGHLVFIASVAGIYASTRSSLYSATKFGLRGFAAGLREDLARSGVGVSVISPGFVREAGMFAEAGAKPPPGLGTVTPEAVAAAVAKAIERNRGEIVVAPFQQRTLARFGARFPEIAGRITRRPGPERIAESVAEGQRNKR